MTKNPVGINQHVDTGLLLSGGAAYREDFFVSLEVRDDDRAGNQSGRAEQ
jgi:hypothetical protein